MDTKILSYIVAITIGFIVMAVLLPVGLEQLYNVTWPASMPSSVETILTTVVPLMAAIGIMLAFMAPVIYKKLNA